VVESPWVKALGKQVVAIDVLRESAPPDFGLARHTFPLEAGAGDPVPWLTDVAEASTDRLADHVVEFLEAASATRDQRVRDRESPLLALPLVGTGHGGWDRKQGDVTRTLVRTLQEWTRSHEADVVLVCWTPQAFAAAQAARRNLATSTRTPTGTYGHCGIAWCPRVARTPCPLHRRRARRLCGTAAVAGVTAAPRKGCTHQPCGDRSADEGRPARRRPNH
jgi:hypothetical protein